MSIQQTFQDALNARDWAAADDALRQGAQVDQPVLGTTSFFLALTNEDVEKARWLKDRGADINATNREGDTALQQLIYNAQLKTFREVIDWGFDLNKTNNQGVSPVLRAALFPHGTPFMSELLKRQANPNLVSRNGNSALLVAAADDRMDMAMMLFDADASPLAINNEGQTVIVAAVHSRNPKMLKLVLDRTQAVRESRQLSVDFASHHSSKPIARAASAGQLEMVIMLMRAGANMNVRDSDRVFSQGLPPLSLLCLHDNDGEASLVKEAIARGANPRLRDYKGRNAFFWTMAQGLDGKHEVLKTLTEAGLDPATPLGIKPVSLFHAALQYEQSFDQNGQPLGASRREVVRALIGMGFPTFPERLHDDDLQDEGLPNMPPPLALALSALEMDVAEELLGGTPLNTLNNDGQSVLHYMGSVKGLHQKELAGLAAAQKVIDVAKQQEKAAAAAEAKVPKDETLASGVFSDSGVNAGSAKPTGKSEKALAKQQEQLEKFRQKLAEVEEKGRALVAQAAQWLADKGANWELRGLHGVTPLMRVAEFNNALLLGQLVTFHGVSLNGVDEQGFGVADYAWNAKSDETLVSIIAHCQKTGDLRPIQPVLLNAVYTSEDLTLSQPHTVEERTNFIQRLRLLPAIPEVLDFADADGNTPLIVAAATRQDDVVQMLLALGANPHLANKAGETALHHAIVSDDADAVRWLRSKGADLRARDHKGQTPEGLALQGSPRVKQAMVQELEAFPELEPWPEQVTETYQRFASAWDRLAPYQSSAPVARRRLFR